jgi:hypothetical protein
VRFARAAVWSLAAVIVAAAPMPRAPARATGPAFELGGWLPYWRKQQGVARVLERLSRFDHVSPFAFRVGADGTPRDTPRIERAPWPALLARARAAGVAVLPTVVWSDAETRGPALVDPGARAAHVTALAQLARDHGFDGLDIDYERKRADEAAGFSAFVQQLSAALHADGRRLSCTVEPRTADRPPPGTSAARASPFRDDYGVLGAHCDQVRVMAYDQHAIEARPRSEPAHAGLDWVRAVVRYTSSHVPPAKLHLGIPTYGWELRRVGARYERVRAVTFPEIDSLLEGGLRSERSPGGELILRRGSRVIVMSDARAVAERVALAREHGLAGIVLFKLDGAEDPALWDALPIIE